MARKIGLAFVVLLCVGLAVVAYSFLPTQPSVDTPASETAPVAQRRNVTATMSPATDPLVPKHQPDGPNVHYNLGLALQSQGKRIEAIREYRKTLEIDNSHAEAHNNLAAALAASDELDDAIDHFRRVVELKPDYAEGHCNLGNALSSQSRFDEAIGHYRRAIELKIDYAKAYNNLAVALKQTGQLQEAYRYMQEAMRLKRQAEP